MFKISINDDLNIIDILRFIQYNNENRTHMINYIVRSCIAIKREGDLFCIGTTETL